LISVKIKVSAVILVIVVSLSIAAWFIHNQISCLQHQNSNLQDHINELQDHINELQDQNRDLHDKNDELQKQLGLLQKRIDYEPEVLIENFSSPYGWQNVVGMTIAITFNVTIRNTGISDIEGLTVEIKRFKVDEDPYNLTRKLDILHAGETTEFQDSFIVGWNLYFSNFHDRSLVATLKLGEVVLDVRYLLPKQYL
jgi:hypothetical protein